MISGVRLLLQVTGLNEKDGCVLAENVTELEIKALPWQIITLKIKVK